MSNYKCYIIYNNNYSYVGITNNKIRRLKQQNKIIKGGAKYTTSKNGIWNYMCYIDGFKCKKDALKFEWALKHIKVKKNNINHHRIIKLYDLLKKKYWTSKSPCSIDYKLTIYWCDITFIPELYDTLPKYISHDLDFN